MSKLLFIEISQLIQRKMQRASSHALPPPSLCFLLLHSKAPCFGISTEFSHLFPTLTNCEILKLGLHSSPCISQSPPSPNAHLLVGRYLLNWKTRKSFKSLFPASISLQPKSWSDRWPVCFSSSSAQWSQLANTQKALWSNEASFLHCLIMHWKVVEKHIAANLYFPSLKTAVKFMPSKTSTRRIH